MRNTVLASLLGWSLASGACAEPPLPLDLRFTLSVDGRVVGTPRLVLQPGAPGRINVAGSDGGGYQFDVRADLPATPTDPASIILATALHARVEGAWRPVGEPTLQIALDGRPASVQVDRTDGGPAHYRIEVSATVADAASFATPVAGR